jgi:DNA polymerase-3 subunit epsilon
MPTDRIAVVDVETTGLSPWRHDRIVEIAIVLVSPDGEIHAAYETLVNPKRDLGPTRIHQISASDVLRAPSFTDVAGDVLDILRDGFAIAGHNVSLDMNFLVKEYERLGVTIPEMPLLCTFRLLGRNSLEIGRASCRERV